MIQLAKAKKLGRKKLYKKHKQSNPQINIKTLTRQQYLNFLWPLFILLFVVFGVTIILQKTLFDTTNYITDIQRSSESIQQYDNPYLYQDIQEHLSGKNVYTLNYFWYAGLLWSLQQKYPTLTRMQVNKTLANAVAVELDFIKPDILFQLQERKFGIWKWWILEVFSGNTIADEVFTVHLPLYASGIQFIDGIFYDVPQEQLLQDLYMIHNAFPQAERIVYMPWSQTTVVFVYKKKIYINHTHDISAQMRMFYGLEKYYTWFSNLGVIDLGSLEDGQAIVK